MTDFFSFKRPSPDPKKAMTEILKKGTAINLGLNDRGETVYLLIDFDRPDRRPLTTIKVGDQFLSPQDYLNNV